MENEAVHVSLFLGCLFVISHIGPFNNIGPSILTWGGLLLGGAGAVWSVDLTGIHSHSHSRHLRKAARVLIGAQLLCELLYAPQSFSVADSSKL